MTLPSGLGFCRIEPKTTPEANRFCRASQGPAKVFAAFCLCLSLCAPLDAAHGADEANAGVAHGPGTSQLAQANDAKLIRNIQDALAKLGYAVGSADGQLKRPEKQGFDRPNNP